LIENLARALLAILAVSFVGSLIVSFQWEMEHDAPIMMYIAYLIDRFGHVPYLEIFDMNLPGTYAAHVLLGRVYGYSDLGFRLADTTVLLAVLGLGFASLRRFSLRVACAGTLLVGCAYLSYGPRRSLQREFLMLLPLAGCLWVTLASHRSLRARTLLLGVLAGLATTIKPHAALGLPIFLWFACRDAGAASESARATAQRGLRALPALAAGFAAPLLAAWVYLWSQDAVAPFWKIAGGYWPLYGEIAQNLSIVSGSERPGYLFRGWLRFGAGHFADSPLDVVREGFAGWFPAAALGFWMARSSPTPGGPRLARLLLALAIVYSFYPVFSGKFWGYHWQPFLYFVQLLAALCLTPVAASRRLAAAGSLALLAVTAFFLLNLDAPFRPHPYAHSTNPLKRRHEAIASYLQEHLEPGDRVQPLDWTGGAIHGMLLADAELATSFVYDFHFYHHVDTPFIQELRHRFVRELSESKPRYVIDIQGLKPSVKTAAARAPFPELAIHLDVNYAPVHRGTGFVIYERTR